MYKKVSTDLNFVAREKEVEDFWKEQQIFQKSMENIMGNMMKKMKLPSGKLTPDQATQVFLEKSSNPANAQ